MIVEGALGESGAAATDSPGHAGARTGHGTDKETGGKEGGGNDQGRKHGGDVRYINGNYREGRDTGTDCRGIPREGKGGRRDVESKERRKEREAGRLEKRSPPPRPHHC
eukprot:scaffold268831_cov31-Tisochrysis_lutea.AAC.1